MQVGIYKHWPLNLTAEEALYAFLYLWWDMYTSHWENAVSQGCATVRILMLLGTWKGAAWANYLAIALLLKYPRELEKVVLECP